MVKKKERKFYTLKRGKCTANLNLAQQLILIMLAPVLLDGQQVD
jgi:hypothetical protein